MCKSLRMAFLTLAGLAYPLLPVMAEDFGLPAEIQQGNILHCFNWTPSEVKAELRSIAEAGFGSVQISPLQRPDVGTGYPWHDLYRPFDLSFQSSDFCSEKDLKDLCEEASKYGIKIIVDVVANHVDDSAGYHDSWWDSDGRIRREGGINYDDRYSITHGQLGDYGDINSELPEVAAKGKAYVEKLKELGVSGIRWDAAKHIGLPSENCDFWKEVTSVPGMYHYGEILDSPGDDDLIKEYVTYMSVTDNRYSDDAAKYHSGIPTGYAGTWVVDHKCPDDKMVYWGESHDTYSNDDGWSKYHDQSNIDRAYAAFACRNGATALYLVRPDQQDFNSIRLGKGRNNSYKSKHIAEVNKFRNIMNGRPDWFENSGNACSITRKDGGAVIVAESEGYVTVKNGNGYCPQGKYKDRISGHEFTVTATEIFGQVGEDCISVIYPDNFEPDPTPNPNPDPDPTPTPDPDPDPTPAPMPDGTYVYFHNEDEDGNVWGSSIYVWAWNGSSNCCLNDAYPGDKMIHVKDNIYRWDLPEGKIEPAQIIFSNQKGKKAGDADLQYLNHRTYFPSGLAKTINYDQPDPTPDPTPDPDPTPVFEIPDALYVLGDIEGMAWEPTRGVEMVLETGNVFISREKIRFVSSRDGNSYFGLTDSLGSDWDDLNSRANRYGPSTKDEYLSLNGQSDFQIFRGNEASSANSWKIKPGVYYVKADFNTGRVELAESTVVSLSYVESEAESFYYTLQGVRVENPQSGIFIRITAKGASKVRLP